MKSWFHSTITWCDLVIIVSQSEKGWYSSLDDDDYGKINLEYGPYLTQKEAVQAMSSFLTMIATKGKESLS